MFGMRGHGRKKKEVSQQSAEILRLTPDNATFTTKNGFPSLTLKTETEEKIFSKVSLRRTFPFELLLSLQLQNTRKNNAPQYHGAMLLNMHRL